MFAGSAKPTQDEERSMTDLEIARACSVARQKLAEGRTRDADTILTAVRKNAPRAFPVLVLLAQIRETIGDAKAAVSFYEEACEALPGHAFPFTRRAMLLLREGRPLMADAAEEPCVQMPDLGSNGRFGNQILQYAALRIYAEESGVPLACPDWIGRELFALQDKTIAQNRRAPPITEEEACAVLKGQTPARPNVSLSGYFCSDGELWTGREAQIRSFFRLAPRYLTPMNQALASLRQRGRTVVAMHLRRGDFGSGRYWIAPTAWYRSWLEQHWSKLDSPVLYIASDSKSLTSDFSEYSPVTAEQLCSPIRGAEFFTDHWILQNADYVHCSNSTFSVTAALLNRIAKECYRPDRVLAKMRPFDPFGEPILQD